MYLAELRPSSPSASQTLQTVSEFLKSVPSGGPTRPLSPSLTIGLRPTVNSFFPSYIKCPFNHLRAF